MAFSAGAFCCKQPFGIEIFNKSSLFKNVHQQFSKMASVFESSSASSLKLASRVCNQKPSIWVSINNEVVKCQPVNLGQGFPDILPRQHVLDSLRALTTSECNPLLHQYTRSMGHPKLVNVLSKLYTPYLRCSTSGLSAASPLLKDSFTSDRSVDSMSEVMVSVGAYGSLFAAISSLIDHGDEVIIMDPSFDCYAPMTTMAGGVPVYVPLRPPAQSESVKDLTSDDWRLDFDEVKSKITPRTKMIVLNNPHNPLGKVFDLDELEAIAELCLKHNLICLSDEVYEWLVFPPKKHIKIASLPGMWARTLTVGSAGKTFSVTGWKLGWTVGPARFIHGMQMHQQNSVYTCPTPIQEAVATSLEIELPLVNTVESYFHEMCQLIEPKGRRMVQRLSAAGMTAVRPTGGYFLFVDISKMKVPHGELPQAPDGDTDCYDVRFNLWMMKNKKLSGIPMSVFYSNENKRLGEKYLRFCFFKEDATLDKACSIVENW